MAKTTKFFNIINNRTASITLPIDTNNKFVLGTTTGTGSATTANVYNLQFSSILYTVPSGKVARFYPMDIYDAIGTPFVTISGTNIGTTSTSTYYASVYAEFRLKIGNGLQRSYAIRYSTDRGMGYATGGGYPSATWTTAANVAVTPMTHGFIDFGENNKYMQAIYGGVGGVGNITIYAPTSIGGTFSNHYMSAFATDGINTFVSSYSYISNSAYWFFNINLATWANSNAQGAYVIAQGAPDTTFSQNTPVVFLSSGETIEVVRSLSATISNLTGNNYNFLVSSTTFDNPCRYKFFIVEEDANIL